jgi:hypothetical protein
MEQLKFLGNCFIYYSAHFIWLIVLKTELPVIKKQEDVYKEEESIDHGG